MRLCLGCQQMKSKKELVRIVKSKENEISIDFTGKKAGRGAYICKSIACYETVKRQKKIEKAFGTVISNEVYNTLRQQLEEFNEQ